MTSDTASVKGRLVASMTEAQLEAEIARPDQLVLEREEARGKLVESAWAPFDFVNRGAAVAIVGITPGRYQMGVALRAYAEALRGGHAHEAALEKAKVHASFSGVMRNLLIEMLDHVGVNAWLGLASSAALFDTRPDLAHFTSALRYPVFIDGVNYSGRTPNMLKVPVLTRMVETVLAEELAQLPDHAIVVPLGNAVERAVLHAAARIPGFNPARVLCGLPHPSPGNRGEIHPFLGLPPAPTRTKPVAHGLTERRERLIRQIGALPRPPVRASMPAP